MPRKATSRPAATSRTRLVAAADLSSDDDFDHTQASMLPSPDSSDLRIAAPAPAPRARASAKPASRAPKTAAPGAQTKKRARAALTDVTNVADEDSEPEPEPERKRAKPAAKKTKARQPTAAPRRVKKAEPVPVEEEEVEDVHASVEQLEESIEESHIAPLRTVVPQPAPQATAGYSHARSVSRQPDLVVASSVRRHRAGSASSVERAGLGDPALRRRLGELQNKFEAQQVRYQNLKDVATAEAQTNFERLKAATDARVKCRFASLRLVGANVRLQHKTVLLRH
jgi:hypothetical protein